MPNTYKNRVLTQEEKDKLPSGWKKDAEYWVVEQEDGTTIPVVESANVTKDEFVKNYYTEFNLGDKSAEELNALGDIWSSTFGQKGKFDTDLQKKIKEYDVTVAKEQREGTEYSAREQRAGTEYSAREQRAGTEKAAEEQKEGQIKSSEKQTAGSIFGSALQAQTAAYQTAGGIFGSQIKPSLDVLSDLSQKVEDKTIDRGSFVSKADEYAYLESLGIAPKLIASIDDSQVKFDKAGKSLGYITIEGRKMDVNGLLTMNDLNMIKEQIDYTSVKVDHTLVLKRKSTGQVQSESDPVDLVYIPKEVKEDKFKSMGIDINKNADLVDGDMIHNVEKDSRIKSVTVSAGKYFITDDSGAKVEVSKHDVYGQYKQSGIALIGNKDATGKNTSKNNKDTPLTSMFVRVDKGFHNLYHEQPDTQQKLFDALLKDEDLNSRKLRAGLINGWMESSPMLAGLFKLLLAIFPNIFSKKGKGGAGHGDDAIANAKNPEELRQAMMSKIIDGMPVDIKPELQTKYKESLADDKKLSDKEARDLLQIMVDKGQLNTDQKKAAQEAMKVAETDAPDQQKADPNKVTAPSTPAVDPNKLKDNQAAPTYLLDKSVTAAEKPKVEEMAQKLSKKAEELFVDGKISDADKKEILGIINSYGYKDVKQEDVKFREPTGKAPAKINIYTEEGFEFKVKEIVLH